MRTPAAVKLVAAAADGEAAGTSTIVTGLADLRSGRRTAGFAAGAGRRGGAKARGGAATGVRLMEDLQVGHRPVQLDGRAGGLATEVAVIPQPHVRPGEALVGAQDYVLVAQALCCAARVGADDDPGIGRPTINPGDDVPDLAPGCLPGNQEVLLLQHYLLRYFVVP